MKKLLNDVSRIVEKLHGSISRTALAAGYCVKTGASAMRPMPRNVKCGLVVVVALVLYGSCGLPAWGEELPAERPLWDVVDKSIHYEREQMRSASPPSDSPSGSNRVFSFVSKPTYSIHPAAGAKANGVGLVICPGGGYRDVWLDREGHDLAIWLKDYGVTSLVLKYRTNTGDDQGPAYSWDDYLPVVQADARQAIRVLRRNASAWQVDPGKIGICGFSAGGNLALLTLLYPEPKATEPTVSGTPDFAGLFYPWLREDYRGAIADRAVPASSVARIPPVFIMNASDDRVTPADKCVEFSAALLKAGVSTELHLFSKGNHGFDLGVGRGESAALWPHSFVAWLRDTGFIADPK